MNYLRQVATEDLARVAADDHDSILLASYDPPLTPPQVQVLVADISSSEVRSEEVAVRSVTPTPEIEDSTALSLDRLSSHTDGSFLPTPPPRFLLSCQEADPGGGGVSTFTPVDQIVEAAPDWVLDALSTAEFRFLKTYDGDLQESFVAPVLSRRGDGAWLIRWRGDHIYRPEVVDEAGTRAEEATAWLYDHVKDSSPVMHSLDRGQLALIPNGRFLHGRTALTPGSNRCVLRAWVF